MSPIVHLKPGCFSYLLLPATLRPGLLRLSALGFTPQFILFPSNHCDFFRNNPVCIILGLPSASCPAHVDFPRILLFSWASPAAPLHCSGLGTKSLLTDAPPGTLAGMNSCCVRITWTPTVLSSISDLAVVSYSGFSGFS